MIAGYSLDTLAFLWLGALLGGIAAGGAGFAFGLAASSIWLHRIDPLHSTICSSGCGVLLHLTDHLAATPARGASRGCGRSWSAAWSAFRSASMLLAYTDAGILKIGARRLPARLRRLRAARRRACTRSRPAAAAPTRASASSAAFSAALAAIPAFCRRSGRNCAAGRRRRRARVYQPYHHRHSDR